MLSLTNVPTPNSGDTIDVVLRDQEILIVRRARGDVRDGWLQMTSTHVGDHMLGKPRELREMYGRDLATAIRLARDAGYAQAKAEIRRALGVKD